MLFSTSLISVVLILLYFSATYFNKNSLFHQLDTLLLQDIERVKYSLKFKHDGTVDLTSEIAQPELYEYLNTKVLYLVRNIKGYPLKRSLYMIHIEPPMAKFSAGKTISYQNFKFSKSQYRLLNVSYKAPFSNHKSVIIQAIRPLEPYLAQTDKLNELLLWLLPLTLVVTAMGIWWLLTTALKPLNRLIATVDNIGPNELSVPIAESKQIEIQKLTSSFNHFLERINTSFLSLKRFSSSASHELRTPLTAMRIQGELALNKSRDKQYYRDAIGSMLEDIERLEHLITSLLELTKADAGFLNLKFEQTNISNLVRSWIERVIPVAEEKNIHLDKQIADGILLATVSTLFERIISNLIENAINYTPKNGKISIRLTTSTNTVILSVTDNGPGIPEDQHKNIFERFTRLDSTRHNAPGFGLGLAIAAGITQLHHGQLTVHNASPHGASFVASFPLSSDSK